jgi:hypothetical protein
MSSDVLGGQVNGHRTGFLWTGRGTAAESPPNQWQTCHDSNAMSSFEIDPRTPLGLPRGAILPTTLPPAYQRAQPGCRLRPLGGLISRATGPSHSRSLRHSEPRRTTDGDPVSERCQACVIVREATNWDGM